ncbi:MAG: outer membrane beta-barrel family protein, partial [Bacteroidia bacterium]
TAKTGRLSANTALGGNYAYAQSSRVVMLNQTTLNNGAVNTISQDGFSKWGRDGFNGSLGLDYDFNAYNNISTNAKFNRFSNGGPGESDYIINGIASKNISNMDMTMNNLDWNMDYKKTSKKVGEEFSISAQLSTGRTPQTFSNTLTSSLYAVPLATYSSNTGKNNEYTVQSDYTYPFSKATTLEVGAKGIFRDFNSQFDASARDFKYNQNVASLYSVISFNLTKKLQVKGGVRGEYTAIDFNTKTSGVEKNDYLNLFPSVVVAQTLKGSTVLKLSYNRRIQRPSQTFLNPFRNESDQFNIMQGNPQLNPELSDNLELGYSTFIKGSIINASVFYRRTNGIIENAISPISENGVNKTFTTYLNVGSLKTFGFNLFGSYNPKPKWTLMSSVGMNSYDINSEIVDVNRTYYMFNVFARSAYAFGKGLNLEFFGVATSPRRTFQGKTDAFYFYGGAFKKEILKKKGSIGVNVLNPFTRDLKINTNNNSLNSTGTVLQSTQIYYPLRSFGVNFSYTFGKLKFTEKKKIKNDDVKMDQQQGGGQMGGMGGNQK